MRTLTEKRKQVLLFIVTYFKRYHHIPPSRLAAERFGYGQNAAIQNYRALRDLGYIESVGNGNRHWRFGKKYKVILEEF